MDYFRITYKNSSFIPKSSKSYLLNNLLLLGELLSHASILSPKSFILTFETQQFSAHRILVTLHISYIIQQLGDTLVLFQNHRTARGYLGKIDAIACKSTLLL